MKNELEKVMSGRDMTENEMNMLANSIIQGELSEVQIASFLVALKMKGSSKRIDWFGSSFTKSSDSHSNKFDKCDGQLWNRRRPLIQF